MSFFLSELIVESVIREGLTALRRDPTLVPDLFGDLLSPYLASKYGQKELNKIQEFFTTGNEISVVHSFNLVSANTPCISIQLLDNPEEEGRAKLDDFEADLQTPITDPEDLAALVLVDSIQVDEYDPLSGRVLVDDATDLSDIRAGNIFVDADDEEFQIQGGVVDTPGYKQLILLKGLDPNISGPCFIKSQINFTQTEVRGVMERERLILGVHTKEPLLTKYLYVALKYILLSRKKFLIERGFQNTTYSGSDFTRNLEYPGDQVFSRFLTMNGLVENSWTSDKVQPITAIDTVVKVPKAVATTEELGLENSTVQVQDDE
jgi:hypothetical protein